MKILLIVLSVSFLNCLVYALPSELLRLAGERNLIVGSKTVLKTEPIKKIFNCEEEKEKNHLNEVIKNSKNSLKHFNLSECIGIGIKNNPELQAEKLLLDESAEKRVEAGKTRMPQIKFQHVQVHIDPLPSIGAMSIGNRQTDISKLIYQQPVYQFGKIKQAENLASKGIEFQQKNVDSFKQKLIFQIIEAYFSILKLDNLLKISELNEKLLKNHLDLVNKQFSAGIVLKTDVLSTQVRLLESGQKTIELKNNRKTAMQNLFNLLNIEINEKISLINYEKIPDFLPDYENAVLSVLNNNVEIQKILKLIEIQDSKFLLEKKSTRPSLSVQANYSSGSEFNDELENWGINLILEATVLENGQSASRQKQVRLVKDSLNKKLENIENQLRLQLQTQINLLNEYREKIVVIQKIIETSEANSKQVKLQYENGVTLNTDVLSADLALFNARSAFSVLKYDCFSVIAKIYHLTGKIEEFPQLFESEKSEEI